MIVKCCKYQDKHCGKAGKFLEQSEASKSFMLVPNMLTAHDRIKSLFKEFPDLVFSRCGKCIGK
jgi:hypothetical protein